MADTSQIRESLEVSSSFQDGVSAGAASAARSLTDLGTAAARQASAMRAISDAANDSGRIFDATSRATDQMVKAQLVATQAAAEQTRQLAALNQTQAASLQLAQTQAPVYAALSLAITGVTAATKLQLEVVQATSAALAKGAQSIGEWFGAIATGNLSSRFTPELVAYGEAVDGLSAKLGVTTASVYGLADAQTALKTDSTTTVAIFSRLSEAIDTLATGAGSAREAAAALGVDLQSFTRDQAAQAIDAITEALKGYQDGAQKTKLIKDIFGSDAPDFILKIANAQKTWTAEGQRHNDMLAVLSAQQKRFNQELADLAVELAQPGWFGRQIQAVEDFFTISDRYKQSQQFIANEAGEAWTVFFNKLTTGALDFERLWKGVSDYVVNTAANISGSFVPPAPPIDQRAPPLLTASQMREGEVFLGSLDPETAALTRYNDGLKRADDLFLAGKLSSTGYAAAIATVGQRFVADLDPLSKTVDQLDRANKLFAVPQGPARGLATFLSQSEASLGNDPATGQPKTLTPFDRSRLTAGFNQQRAGQAGDAVSATNADIASLKAQAAAAFESAGAVEKLKAQQQAYAAVLAGSPVPQATIAAEALAKQEAQLELSTATLVRTNKEEISANIAISDAYQISTAAGIKEEATQRALIAAKEGKIAAGTAELVAQQDLDKQAAATVDGLDKQIAATTDATTAQAALAAAASGSAADFDKAQAHAKAVADTATAMAQAEASGAQIFIDAVQRQRDALEALYNQQTANAHTQAANQEVAANDRNLQLLQAQLATIGEFPALRDRELALVKAKLDIETRYADIQPEIKQRLLDQAAAAGQLTGQIAEAQKQQQLFDRAISQAANRIDTELTTALANVFSGQKVTDWGQQVRNVLSQIAAELVNLALIKPAIGSVLGTLGIGGAAGGFGGGGSFLFGAGGGGGSASSTAQVISPDGKLLGNITTPGSSSSSSGSSGLNLPGGSLFNGSGGNSLFSGSGALSASSINDFGVAHFGYQANGGVIAGAAQGGDTLSVGTGAGQVASEVPSSGALGGSTLSGDLAGIAGVAGSALAVAGAAYGLAQFAMNPTVKSGASASAGVLAAATLLLDLGPYGWIAAAVLAVISVLLPDAHHADAGGFSNVILGGPGQAATPSTQYSANGSDISGVQNMVTGQILPFIQNLAATFGPATSFQGIEVGAGFSNRGESDYTKLHPNLTAGADIIDIMDPSDPKQVDAAYTKFAEDLLASATTIDGLHGDWVKLAAQMGVLGTTSQEFAANIAFIQTGFDKGVKAWATTGDAVVDAMNATAAQAGQSFHDNIVGPMDQFNAKAASLGIPLDQATAAQANYVQVLLGIKDATGNTTTVTGKYQQSVANAMAQMESFRGELERFGITAAQLDDAEAKMIANQDKAREAEIKATDNSLAGKDYLNTAQQIADSYTSAVQDAAATKGSMTSANQLFLDQISHSFAGLTGDQIREVEHTFDGMSQTVKDMVIPALEALAKAADTAAANAETNAVRDSHLAATGRGYISQIDSITGAAAKDINSGKPIGDVISILGDTIATTFANLSPAQLHDLAATINHIADSVTGPFADALHTMAANVEATAHSIDDANMVAFNARQTTNQNAANGKGYLNDTLTLFNSYKADAASAPGAGSLQLTKDSYLAQFTSMFKNLTADQLADADKMGRGFDPLVDAALDAAEKFQKDAAAAQAEADARQKNIDGLTSSLTTLTDHLNALDAAIASLQSAIDALTIGSLSPNGAFQKRADALAIEQTTLKAAQGGDLTAASRLGSDVNNFLQASAAYQTIASTGYSADYNQALGDLRGVQGTLTGQRAQTAGSISSTTQQLHDLGVPGFAAGGMTGTLAQVHGGELLYTGPPARVWSAEQSRAMMAGGRGAANDDSDEVSLLRQLVTKLERQNTVLEVGLEAVRTEMRGMRGEQARVADETHIMRVQAGR